MNLDFDQLYRQPDPFGYASRWYEQRKRDLLLAMLPRRRFHRGWELGCSTGVLTRLLAERCEQVLGTDVSPRAIAQAQAAGAPPNLAFECSVQPRQWPPVQFDLIVFSEVGYYLDAATLATVSSRLAESRDAAREGGLVACHWRHPFEGRLHSAEAVHAQLAEACGGPPSHRYEDQDLLLEAWWPGASVATREGLA
ncbi:SAM-dependent methyltransferase [Stenotrophomonas sp. HITSZ_GD]|uniref:methyltransferase n=1 Tax=Stenotrophomonas sp. HITSZ_GD TaxID=3037248 RepID=UPI00240DCA62|nr:class I SAM-dependent methyltransferase [Stenotrophomonas sp. HITSZ_GD]MDG2525931.1 SAM-dependent methyltransferase [Stenotrophomonas sp. HITSZ_GD]